MAVEDRMGQARERGKRMRNKMEHKAVQSFFGPFKYMISFMLFAIVILAFIKPVTTVASTVTGSQVNVVVNYIEQTATVTAGAGGSTKFYISIDNKKTWEDVPIVNGAGVVDISGLLSTKEVLIYFKGDKDTAVINEQKLMAEPNTVTAAYVIRNGVGYIDYKTTGAPVEYRNGTNGNWKTPPVSFPTAMYELKGATIQFRSSASIGMRAGKIISVKVPKRPTPPSVKVDGSKLMITGIKANSTQVYDPTISGWRFVTTDTKVKTISLYDLAKISSTAYNTQLPAGAYEFRTAASDKKAASGVKLIEIPTQPIAPTSIKIEGSTVTITDDAKKAYEYCKLSNGTTFNAATMKWTSITPNKPTIIPKANVTDVIYVRLKSTVDKDTKLTIPASTCVVLYVNSITTK